LIGLRILLRPMSITHRATLSHRGLPTRGSRSLIALVALVVALGAAPTASVAAASPSSVPTDPVSPASSAAPYRLNLASRDDFVAQANLVQCVGASIQMMLNIVRPGADRSAATQRRLQQLARAWSGPRPDGTTRKGAGIRGWAAGLVIEQAGPYRIVGAHSLDEAMQIAALSIRTYRRPVGLLVWRGRHAWVMSGFEATTDPAIAPGFRVTKAYILDPLYPHGSKVWGPSPKPGTAISVAAVGSQFVRRRTGGPWNALPGASRLAGKYVLLVPTGPGHPWYRIRLD